VGLKPSDGRVPFHPNTMVWQPVSFVNGPITRTVADAALMLDVMAGPDPRDPRSLADGAHDFSAAAADESPIAGLRVGYLPDLGFIPVDPAVAEICRAAVEAFSELGCAVEEDHTDFSDVVAPYALINATRRAATVAPYRPEHEDEFDPEVLWRCQLAESRTAVDFGNAVVVQSSAYERVRLLLQRYDVLVTPTVAIPPFPLPSTGWRLPAELGGRKITNVLDLAALTFLFNLTGHPAISVPAGWTDTGLPVGFQIVGPWRDDAKVLRVAAAYERARPWHDRWPALAGAAA
jgi:Asp-tRNA(Asn)/Glu-tRNA(Gln) amidotransferase A subunit family amidase